MGNELVQECKNGCETHAGLRADGGPDRIRGLPGRIRLENDQRHARRAVHARHGGRGSGEGRHVPFGHSEHDASPEPAGDRRPGAAGVAGKRRPPVAEGRRGSGGSGKNHPHRSGPRSSYPHPRSIAGIPPARHRGFATRRSGAEGSGCGTGGAGNRLPGTTPERAGRMGHAERQTRQAGLRREQRGLRFRPARPGRLHPGGRSAGHGAWVLHRAHDRQSAEADGGSGRTPRRRRFETTARIPVRRRGRATG